MTGAAVRLAGVMGWPVAHSRSPTLHGHWLQTYGIDGAYVRLAVRPDRLGQALAALPALGFAGCNLTLPHKEAALGLVDRLAPSAVRAGAVNTVVVLKDGALEGSCTDGDGFLASVAEAAPAWSPRTGPAVLVGAGGAARAIAAALLDAGCPELRVVNRTSARAQALASALGGAVDWLPWERRHAALDGAALVVNTTTRGMAGEAPLDLDLAMLPVGALVADAVYVPLETPLLAAARRRGLVAVDGLGMLLHQARPGFRRWFGVDPEVTPALRARVLATLGP